MRLPGLLLPAVLAAAAPAAEPEACRLRLRGQTTVYGETVTLGDVLLLAQADAALARQIEREPLAATPAPGGRVLVTHAQVVQRLQELGVNLARVLVDGALRCEVTLARPPDGAGSAPQRAAEGPAPLLRPPAAQDAAGPRTLADALRAHVNAELADLEGTAELTFERAGQEFLELTAPPWDFSISGGGGARLGLREFRVLIRRDGRVQRTAHVFAHVRLLRQVVVARRPLSLGNFVRTDDVALETRVFGEGDDLGLHTLEQAVGQQVKRFVPAGELVPGAALKSVDLVQRSRPVTVVGAGQAVQVRLSGVALDSGGYGATVRVRLGDARNGRQMVRGIVTGLGTVRLAEGNL